MQLTPVLAKQILSGAIRVFVGRIPMAREATRVRQASIGFNKVTGAIQLSVPQGTKLVDALKSLATIDASALAKLPRGCPGCISGHPFQIREDFDPIINVKLGQGL
jgi:hypothetical protein